MKDIEKNCLRHTEEDLFLENLTKNTIEKGNSLAVCFREYYDATIALRFGCKELSIMDTLVAKRNFWMKRFSALAEDYDLALFAEQAYYLKAIDKLNIKKDSQVLSALTAAELFTLWVKMKGETKKGDVR